jgi:signal transduction histidine kinase
VVSIFGRADALQEAVLELVRNAAEALEDGGVISLATGTVDASRAFLASAFFDDGLPAGRYAYVEVSDTGRGMDAATIARMFDPGFSTRSPERGLGLPQVLGIVREHPGAEQVYSKPDIGTTVRILIPTEILVLSGRMGHTAEEPDPTRERLLALGAQLRASYSSSAVGNE